jgi:hypothetical protein
LGGDGGGPSAMPHTQVASCRGGALGHTGHARWPERPSLGPWGHDLVDGRVVQGR